MKNAMERTVGFWLQRAARLHRARIAEAVQDLGLFPGQEQLLIVLSRGEARTVGEIAEALKVRPPTVSKTLLRLAGQNLIARHENGDDARKSTIILTKEGARRAQELSSRMAEVERDLVNDLDGKEERRIRKGLKRMSRALASDADAAKSAPEPEEAEGA